MVGMAEQDTSVASSEPRVAVVVPTYNEADNLPELSRRLFALGIGDLHLYVVDDGSPDGTADVARALCERYDGRVEVISRPGKQGLGTAYIAGFRRALDDGSDFVVQMDADLSHPPEQVPAMLERSDKADVVVGSRYTACGRVDPSWSLKRRLLSAFGNHTIRLVTGVSVRDATSGFKLFKAEVLRSLDTSALRCKGFGFQAEVAHQCQARGYAVVEHPITFIDRIRGQSKMSLHIVVEAIWRLSLLRLRNILTSAKSRLPSFWGIG